VTLRESESFPADAAGPFTRAGRLIFAETIEV